jgi:flagellar biosynthesis protein FlhB
LSEKTEEPTPRRLRKAREDGDAGASAYAAQSIAFLVAVLLSPGAVRSTALHAAGAIRGVLLAEESAVSRALRFEPQEIAIAVLSLALPLLAGSAAASAVAHAIQTGGFVTGKRITPKIERLDPFAGFRSLFSAARTFAVARAIAGGAVVAWLAYDALAAHAADVARTAGRPTWVPPAIAALASGMALRAALVGLLLGGVDLVVTRRAWLRRLRMTKAEVKREHRDAEGDPQLKAARERAHHELLAQATLAAIKNASVVVVNPTHLACALRYDDARGDAAPVVVASGRGDGAAQITRAAHAYGVPLVRDVPLARALTELETGDTIPEALYEAVAAILAEIAAGGRD